MIKDLSSAKIMMETNFCNFVNPTFPYYKFRVAFFSLAVIDQRYRYGLGFVQISHRNLNLFQISPEVNSCIYARKKSGNIRKMKKLKIKETTKTKLSLLTIIILILMIILMPKQGGTENPAAGRVARTRSRYVAPPTPTPIPYENALEVSSQRPGDTLVISKIDIDFIGSIVAKIQGVQVAKIDNVQGKADNLELTLDQPTRSEDVVTIVLLDKEGNTVIEKNILITNTTVPSGAILPRGF